jgi:phosphomannomutase
MIEEGKAFVRPSGTEDILRLYSEAKTIEEVE